MILYIAVLNLLLTLVIVYHNYRVIRSVLYLAICLVSVSVMSMTHYFFTHGTSRFWFSVFFIHFIPVYYLFGPFLYFYVRSVLTDRARIRTSDFWHFLPALFFLFHILPHLFSPWDYKMALSEDILRDYRNTSSARLLFPIPSFLNYVLRNLSSLGYITYCLMWVFRFDRNYPGTLRISHWEARKVLRFLKLLIGVCLFASLMFMVVYGRFFLDSRLNPMEFIENPLMPLLGIGLFAIPFIILFNPEVLFGIPQYRQPVPVAQLTFEAAVRENSSVAVVAPANGHEPEAQPVDGEGRFQGLAERILAVMEQQKPYLSPEFSIEDLAQRLDVPKHHVYYCFNSILKTRFSRMRSEFRVRHVQALIREGSTRTKTLEAIGLESGFSSPSTFYAVFREVAGMTPSEYLQSLDQAS